jgi:hypothetical protein
MAALVSGAGQRQGGAEPGRTAVRGQGQVDQQAQRLR